MEIATRAGDVVLLAHGDDKSDPVSLLIQKVTGSPYSHTILCLGDGQYADASPAPNGAADLSCFDEERLIAGLDSKAWFLLLRPSQPAVADTLREAVDVLIDRANATGDPIIFSDGALAGLGTLVVLGNGLLRSLDEVRGHGAASDNVERLRAAIFYALEDGDRRLFCSEFVYRALTAAGARPSLPAQPIVNMRGFPLDDPEHALIGWLESVRLWLQSRWSDIEDWLLRRMSLDRDSLKTFDEVWDTIQLAYEEKRSPKQLTVANFFTPADFKSSSTFDELATKRKGGPWLPI